MAAGRSPVDDRECLGPEAQAGEFAMLALRMTEGLDRARFLGRYGRDPAAFFGETILRHSVAGRLLVTPSHVRLTPAGLMVADSVIEDFIWVAGEK
jgi:oxygen-independent coproporphyrinogen-3 oxidase